MIHKPNKFDPLYLKGIEHFNNREFFACHEVLENLWLQEGGRSKLFYQGLIQVAVAFYHLENKNYRGAKKLLDDGLLKLENYLPSYEGIDLVKLTGELETWKQRIADILRRGQDTFDVLKVPSIALKES